MPFDPDNPKEFHKLREAIRYARRKMKPFLRFAMDAKRQMVGPHYGDVSKNEYDKVPVNSMEELASTLSMAIAARNPQVLVSTFVEGLVPQAERFQMRLNKLVREINLAKTFRAVIVNAVFGPGVVRVGVEADRKNQVGGYLHNIGQPFADVIHHSNLVIDMSVDDWELVDFIGDRFRRPLDVLQNNPMYDQDEVDRLSSQDFGSKDDQGLEREQVLSLGMGQYEQRYRKRVDLYHVWLPHENLVVTMHLSGNKPLRVVPFDGPEGGPYVTLSFQEIPGQLWPLAPAYTIWDLDDFVNKVYRKIFRQATREKEVFTYFGEAEDTFRRILDAVDGEAVRTDVQDPVGRVKVGGASPQTIATAIHAHGLLRRRSGTDVMAGLGPVADTATQERIVKGSSDQRVAAMQDRFAEFAEEVVRRLAWYEWTDPLREDVVYRRISGTDYFYGELWSPETREGDFVQYDIHIEPYSMQRQSPASKLQLLFAMFDRTLQAMPILAAQNVVPDINGFYELVSRLANLPELRQMVRFAPSEFNMQGVPAPSGTIRPEPIGPKKVTQARAEEGNESEIMARLLSAAGASNAVGGAS